MADLVEAEPKKDENSKTPRLRMSDFLRRPFDVRSIALTGLFVLAVFYTAYFMRAILLPVVLALFLSYLLTPIVRSARKIHFPPALTAALIMAALIGLIVYGFSAVSVPAAEWLKKAPASLQQVQEKMLHLRRPIEQVAEATSEIEKLATPDDPQTQTAVEVKRRSMVDVLYVQGPEAIVSTALLLILLYFLLAYEGVFLAKVVRLIPRLEDKKRAVSIARDIELHVSRYLATITIINVLLGVAIGLTMHLMGLPNPIFWGVLAAFLNFVPYLGALVGIISVTLAALLSFDSPTYALMFPAAYLALTTLEGQFITPMVIGRSLTLNPVIVLLALTFWGWMWGITGIILAVPILAAFKIFCTHVEQLEPVAEFLS